MLFNSIQFFIFFLIVGFTYFLLPHKHRWKLLLVASYYFYMSWKAEYLILILISTCVDYIAGIQMVKQTSERNRRIYLAFSLITNLGLLFAFKYFNFFNDSIRVVLNQFNIFYNVPAFQALLPVGISFYTFQTLSYTIDVYRGKCKPEKHFGIFALYVSFFPQLVAGPIERAVSLLPQFHEKHIFKYERVFSGLLLITWGLFKKVVVADHVSVFVNNVYFSPATHTNLELVIATYFFAIQIYCDFSGYSDIAIGVARILGFRFMENFRSPYFSKSVAEFWRRWHISLSTWFRDYLYIPLGGNRTSTIRQYQNLLIVFLVSGLWHGANWTFVLWGGVHALFMIFSAITKESTKTIINFLGLNKKPQLLQAIEVFITFQLVCFAWIFFRANSISDAWYIVTHLFPVDISFSAIAQLPYYNFIILGGKVAILFTIELLQRQNKLSKWYNQQTLVIRWAILGMAIFFILVMGVFQNIDFIYFQF